MNQIMSHTYHGLHLEYLKNIPNGRLLSLHSAFFIVGIQIFLDHPLNNEQSIWYTYDVLLSFSNIKIGLMSYILIPISAILLN